MHLFKIVQFRIRTFLGGNTLVTLTSCNWFLDRSSQTLLVSVLESNPETSSVWNSGPESIICDRDDVSIDRSATVSSRVRIQ